MAMNGININEAQSNGIEIRSRESALKVESGLRQGETARKGQESAGSAALQQNAAAPVSFVRSENSPVSLSEDRQGVEKYNGKDGRIYEILSMTQQAIAGAVSQDPSLTQEAISKAVAAGPSLTQKAIAGAAGPSFTQEVIKKAVNKELLNPSLSQDVLANTTTDTLRDSLKSNPFDPKNGEIQLSDLTPNQLKDYYDRGLITQAKYDLELQKRGLDDETKAGVKGDVNNPLDSRKNTSLGNSTKTADVSRVEQGNSASPNTTPVGGPALRTTNSLGGSNNTTNNQNNSDKNNTGSINNNNDTRRQEIQDQANKQEKQLEEMFKAVTPKPEPLSSVLPEYTLPDQTGNFQGKVTMS